jgi:uncharacterized membrane protein required for colicin V production
MPTEIITSLNWVDILLVIVIIRIIYIGAKRGFAIEISKLCGLLLSVVVAYHYYLALANIVTAHSPLPAGFSSLICFIFLLVIVNLLFALFRQGVALIIKVEPLPFLNTWGGALLGALRSWIICSVFLYILFISGFGYIEKSARQSYSAGYFAKAAPAIYSYSFESIISKFFPGEEANSAVFDLVGYSQAPEKKSE